MYFLIIKLNSTFYEQIFGTPMGSSICGLFADIVMGDLESECFKKLSFSLTFYFPYVDVILTCVPADKIDEILSIFNSID